MKLYDKALYYEIAFGFINPKKQADVFEQYIKKFSKIKANRFLDIGCGPAIQLRELAKRGYETVGLDLSTEMLSYVKKRASEENVKIDTINADFRHFRLKKPADFAFIMVGTINYIPKSNQDFLDHLDSVATSLNKGGLYLIENFWINPPRPEKWTGKRGKIIVKNFWDFKMTDYLNQFGTQYWTVKVNDNGKEYVLEDINDRKVIMPQEFITLIKLNNNFEFLGFFEHSSIKKMERSHKNSDSNYVVLRRM